MIQLRGLTLARGARELFSDASLQLHAGWRIGVVGANGSGKSSLLALLRGELAPALGDCAVPAHWRLASVAQETPPLPQPALDYVLDGDHELRDAQAALAAAEAAHDGVRIGELHARLAAIDGYAAPARAAALLAGLGFTNDDLGRPVAEFSGGWRMRLNLARALASRADLLLLDEPTNHLDLDAVVWLERWLAAHAGTLLVISHDREFLDGCTDHILRLGDGRLALYAGNYSAYEDQRAAQLALQQSMAVRQQREVARLTRFVERFRAKASKARQAQSRVKALARMERVVAAHVDAPFEFCFPEPGRLPDPALVLEQAEAGYPGRTVLSGLDCTLRSGARIGLLGPNGAGKSTLMRLLAGVQQPTAGRRMAAGNLAIGYFAQHQLEQLQPERSPLQHLQAADPAASEQVLRDFLGGFAFRGEDADAPVGRFSGGEKARLVLALLVRGRPQLLLLDEPTNHLDLDMRQALTTALAEYDGAMLLVSHDRSLLRACCDEYWLVADGQVREFAGDLEAYLAWLAEWRERQRPTDPRQADTRASRRADREQAGAERRARIAARRPLLREAESLDRQLDELARARDAVDARLADPGFYAAGGEAVASAIRERAELAARIEAAETRWLEVQEAISRLPRD